ncbi:MAG: protocatechuate 3,4-dioxygenase beta subunit [Alphaproteobacteria bacterium]|jgi:protocatechuate 3,4-dioxygenase beta subunit
MYLGAAAAVSSALPSSANESRLTPTAKQVEGPFFPTHSQIDKDADMTNVSGGAGNAAGEPLLVSGRIVDTSGKPVANSIIDIWQADRNGRYLHEDAPESSPLGNNFQYWAKIKSGPDGSYSVKTIKPAKYNVQDDWDRPPHIHFRVAKKGMRELTTQMYFANEALNETDILYLEASVEERASITVEINDGKSNFEIVLATV